MTDHTQHGTTILHDLAPLNRELRRAIPKDGYSAVGPLPRVEGYYAAVTHSGVTLGAFLGVAVADELLRGVTRPELETFRPARFFG